MSDIESLQAYAGQLAEAAAKADAASATQHQIVHGNAQTDVLTESGPVPSHAKQARLYLESIPDAAADLSRQMTDGRIHASEPVGRGLVEDGQLFYALSTDPNISRTLWRRVDASSSIYVEDDPSAAFVAALEEKIDSQLLAQVQLATGLIRTQTIISQQIAFA